MIAHNENETATALEKEEVATTSSSSSSTSVVVVVVLIAIFSLLCVLCVYVCFSLSRKHAVYDEKVIPLESGREAVR